MSCCICIDDLYKKSEKKKMKSSNKTIISKSAKCLELKCGHKFHKNCILDWFYSAKLNSDKCPICRSNIVFKDYSLNELRYNIRFRKIQKTLVSRARKRIRIQNNIIRGRNNTHRNRNHNTNNTTNNTTNSTANPRYYINFNVDYAVFIENNNLVYPSPYISDNTLQEITELYNAADIIPYVNDQNILMDLLYQFRLYNLRLYELRNYIINGREFSDMPILVNENDSDQNNSYNLSYQNNNILSEYQTITPPETYTFYNSVTNNEFNIQPHVNNIENTIGNIRDNIQRNTEIRYENQNNGINVNNEINYDELNEDQKLIDEMDICLECRINNENYLKFINNYIKKNDKEKMQIIKKTKKDKINKNQIFINMKYKRKNKNQNKRQNKNKNYSKKYNYN